MRFVLFVEGDTEQRVVGPFLKRWLDPQLPRRVGIKTVRFEGWQGFNSRIEKKVRMHLEGPSGGQIIAAIGLLDLYGPSFYPSPAVSVSERYKWAKQHLEQRVQHQRFRMYFAVHELEAWLLSQPAIFPQEVAQALRKINRPEEVDFESPPATLLQQLYRTRARQAYKKVVYGVALFERLDPAEAYRRCPYLRAMMDELLHLARQAGLQLE